MRGNNTPFLNGSRPVFSFTSRLINHRKGKKRRERECVREKRERKWGLTGSFGLYPIFALPTTNNQQPLLSSHIGSRSEKPSTVLGESEKRRERESKRKERAKMGTDRFLWSVPDFRITNNQQRTTNNLSYHPTLVLAQKSRPSSTVPEHGPVLRKGEKRRERERVREKRERKWGLTGS